METSTYALIYFPRGSTKQYIQEEEFGKIYLTLEQCESCGG